MVFIKENGMAQYSCLDSFTIEPPLVYGTGSGGSGAGGHGGGEGHWLSP